MTGPAEGPGPWPCLVLEWRPGPDGWSALVVVYVITNEPAVTAIQTWIPGEHLRPA